MDIEFTHQDVARSFAGATDEQRAILMNCIVNYLEVHASKFPRSSDRDDIDFHAYMMSGHLNENTVKFLKTLAEMGQVT